MTPGPQARCFIPIAGNQSNRPILSLFIFLSVLLGLVATTTAWADDDEIDIDRASWSSYRDRLTVRGDNAPDNSTVTIMAPRSAPPGRTVMATGSSASAEPS